MNNKTLVLMLFFVGSLISKEFFYVDYSCFRTESETMTRTDIFISIPIIYLDFDQNLTSMFSIKVMVYDKDKLIKEDRWKQKYSISKEEDKYSGAEIPVMSKIELPP
ncbi:MAG: hypothetical protein L6407_07035, partial [Candidatus Delongbacteria bacterium]|nr:hypothetical protein [Candidatus Delongbacteria bacterium]